MFYSFVATIFKIVLFLLFGIKRVGKENVIDKGAILVANHRSNWDAPAITATCPRQLSFMGKIELFKFKPFGFVLKKFGVFPVNRGKGDIGAVKTSLKILKEEKAMIMFPQGKRMKDGTRGEAKPGVVMLATRARVPVIPVYISGKYRLFSRVTVTYGEPIYLDEYYDEKLSVEKMQEISESIMDKVFALA